MIEFFGICLMAQSSDSGLRKDRSVRSVGHKNFTEVIIEQSEPMHPSTAPLLGHCRLCNRTFGPSCPSSHAPSGDRSREGEEAVGGGPRPCTYSCLLIEDNTVILGSSRHSTDNCFTLQELASPTRPDPARPSLTTTSPIKLRRITRSRHPCF
jgi:hypothetical protein